MKRSPLGSINRSPDGSAWIARLQYRDASGRLRGFKRRCRTHAEARETLKLLREQLAISTNANVTTYRELDTLYRREYLHKARIVDGIKISGYRQPLQAIVIYLNRALEYFGDRPLASVTYSDLENYKRIIASRPTKHGRRRSASDVMQHLSLLRRLFNIAVQHNLIAESPFKRGPTLISRAIERERSRILSREEEIRLLDACNRPNRRRLRQIIIIAIETGLRRGELYSLSWNDVNLDKGVLTVQSTNSKTLRARTVPLSNRAIKVFREIKNEPIVRLDQIIFGHADRKKAFAAACRDAGISGLRFHDLRHTAITRWLEAGISPTLAMKASGHTQFRTFLRYVNPNDDTVREFAARLNAVA